MKNKDVECDIADLVTYCDENDKDVMYDFEYERITNYIEKIEKELELKDKALDKACEKMATICEHSCGCNDFSCPLTLKEGYICNSECNIKKSWKEWCLKDE